MPGLSKVIVLDPDARAGRQIQLGFEREGVPTAMIPAGPAGATTLELPGDDAGLVVVGGIDGQGLELVRRTRALLDDRQIDAPIMFAGRGVERSEAKAAGADEVVLQPAYLRDVVTIGRLLRGRTSAQRAHLAGSLADVTGVFTLVRALAAMGRSGTLTLVRGLRRGEIRFYHGEVTSAQVGMIHGQAALHQLLLWTDARFDVRHEDIVRRQQIPLTPEELFADAEQFLEGVRESSGGLSPSIVLEQDVQRVQSLGKQIPTEVHGVLRMFDGHRVLADVLEDSAYRVFETLRVTQRAVEAGLLRVVAEQPPRATWRTILAIEDWLIGSDPREVTADSRPISTQGSEPVAPSSRLTTTRDERGKSSRKPRRKKKRRLSTPPVAPSRSVPPNDIDWGALVPRIVGAEVGPLAGVVPAAHVSGEILTTSPVAVRDRPDAQPKVVPTVVFDEAAELARHAKAQADARLRAEPTHIVDDLLLDDTKPERMGVRAQLTMSSGGDREVAPPATVIVNDGVAAAGSGAVTTRITAAPVAEVTPTAATTSAAAARMTLTNAASVEAAPETSLDEPSDGVVRQRITTAETAPVKRRRVPSEPPDDDRPGDTMGEITAPRARATIDPRTSEPSILVADLAAVHAEVSAITSEQVTVPTTADAASPSREAPVLEARGDAVAFSEAEEAFFRAGHEREAAVITAPPIVESFDDLDDGYRPVGFWDRLRGKTTGQPDNPTLPTLSDDPAQPDDPGKK